MKTAQLFQSDFSAETTLRQCCLITDGNAHRTDLCVTLIGFTHKDLLSEAMLPEIRTVAMLIAASRCDLSKNSPATFTDEMDWFAARILVLRVRAFHLDVKLNAMLQTANERAKAFAQKLNLPFQAAAIRPSLHLKRPANMLLMECDLTGVARESVFDNSRAVRALIQGVKLAA
ncbi:hypothetical protein [Kingella negevensis]|uniref:hypothetical protein n=1 Tax=Kingella negevensis TaxID=1522312 RepID=UPI0025518114|nr:hypothetical protein [Kingella negevensis]MDK4680683.1 hypothetical protein [Kingella negevensis]MDK4681593.1 hypothetical protein [Kingella negevensis]MDK4689792.1 hypothetical protein [Kingella negevensis]MDK4692865.1 hypothetical protein [Kingella negevensis]MDK4699165.1 hypothetical protein [Kingella negevensis]